jgi:hypothetical protein
LGEDLGQRMAYRPCTYDRHVLNFGHFRTSFHTLHFFSWKEKRGDAKSKDHPGWLFQNHGDKR